MCSKHVEARNKLILKQEFCASSWLNTEIIILRCTVNKTSKYETDDSVYNRTCKVRVDDPVVSVPEKCISLHEI